MKLALILTQCDRAIGPRTSALVLWKIKPQCVTPYRLGDITKILHQVSTKWTSQEGIPQWGWGAVVIPCHGRDQGLKPSLTRL